MLHISASMSSTVLQLIRRSGSPASGQPGQPGSHVAMYLAHEDAIPIARPGACARRPGQALGRPMVMYQYVVSVCFPLSISPSLHLSISQSLRLSVSPSFHLSISLYALPKAHAVDLDLGNSLIIMDGDLL